MRRTFIKDNLEEEFQKEGFVKMPFLSPEEVEVLKSFYFDTLKEQGGPLGPEDENFKSDSEVTYDFTFIDKNSDYKRLVFQKINNSFKEHYGKILDDYEPIIANFIRKTKEAGEVPLHQNWAFVDEMKCTSVSIWCPLVDSNQENGTLEVVPGSHKRFGKVRGPMIKSELLNINKEIIDNHLVPLDTKAGDCVILDDSLVHYSSPNMSEGLRLAIQLILIPKEMPSIHYYMDPMNNPNKVNVLEVDHDFYMEFNPWKKPSKNLKVRKEIDYRPFDLSLQEFASQLESSRFDIEDQRSWWKKLLSA